MHRPDIEQPTVVTISIAELADRTSVHVVQGTIDSGKTSSSGEKHGEIDAQTSSVGRPQQVTVDGAASVPQQETNKALQEIHQLLAERTRAKLKLAYLRKSRETVDADRSKARRIEERLSAIANRLKEIHKSDLASFERVAEHAGLANSEEPRFGQPSYGVILYASSLRNIEAGELLLEIH